MSVSYTANMDFYSDLPVPPTDGFKAANIKGNLHSEAKQLSANAIWWYLTGDTTGPKLPTYDGKVFGRTIAKQMRLSEMEVQNVRSDFSQFRGKFTFEMEVDRETMCNTYDAMHGGATEYLLHVCASALPIILSIASGIECFGPSREAHFQWLRPPRGGKTVIVTCEIADIRGREFTVEGKIVDKASGKLLVKHSERLTAANLPKAAKL